MLHILIILHFNISILKQAAFKIIYICFSETVHALCYIQSF